TRVTQAFTFVEPPAAPPLAVAPALTSAQPSANPWPTRRAGWAVAAGAGALVVVGIAGLVTREWEARIYDDSRCDPLPGQTRQDRCGTHRDLGMAAEGGAIASFIGGGVTAAIAGVLLFTPGSKSHAP